LSVDFSFDRRQVIALCALGCAIAVLLFGSGMLLGHMLTVPANQTAAMAIPASVPKLKVPAAPTSPISALTVQRALNREAAEVSASAGPAAPRGTSAATPADANSRSGWYSLQYGVFRDPANADALLKELTGDGLDATKATFTDVQGAEVTVVRSGRYATDAEAETAAAKMRKVLGMAVMIRPADRL
jgi:cell division septation protein DedD